MIYYNVYINLKCFIKYDVIYGIYLNNCRVGYSNKLVEMFRL
jgi:hypothetical protein